MAKTMEHVCDNCHAEFVENAGDLCNWCSTDEAVMYRRALEEILEVTICPKAAEIAAKALRD